MLLLFKLVFKCCVVYYYKLNKNYCVGINILLFTIIFIVYSSSVRILSIPPMKMTINKKLKRFNVVR